jgi:hypothetical protein
MLAYAHAPSYWCATPIGGYASMWGSSYVAGLQRGAQVLSTHVVVSISLAESRIITSGTASFPRRGQVEFIVEFIIERWTGPRCKAAAHWDAVSGSAICSPLLTRRDLKSITHFISRQNPLAAFLKLHKVSVLH